MIKRSEKLAFMGIATTGSGGTTTTVYKRMTGFTEMSTSKNPKEYSRKYIDEGFERSDVVGYSPSMSYKYDEEVGNDVHALLADIADNELTGEGAKVSILIVDLSAPTTSGGSSFNAILRDFSVIPSSEGDDADTFTRSGNFKAAGDKVFGTASTSDEWQTATFTEAS